MSRVARKILFDKDIRELKPREKAYRVVVGNPSELILLAVLKALHLGFATMVEKSIYH